MGREVAWADRHSEPSMEAQRERAFLWASPKVQWLRDLAQKVPGDNEGPVYEVGPWTLLKLIGARFVYDFCVSIMQAPHRDSGKPKQGFGAVDYIDLNAGAGLVRVRGTQAIFAGSALIAAGLGLQDGKKGFDHLYLVEPKVERAQALINRLAAVIPKDKFDVFPIGADEAVRAIVPRLTARNSNFVALYDPYGFSEGSYESWGYLLKSRKRGDLLATFQSKMAGRHTAGTLSSMLGGLPHGIEDQHLTTEENRNLFMNTVRKLRPCVEYGGIRAGDTGYSYDLVYATALTRGGSSWRDAFRRLKTNLELLDGKAMKTWTSYKTLERF